MLSAAKHLRAPGDSRVEASDASLRSA